MSTNVLISGGAVGADAEFLRRATTRGDRAEICLGQHQEFSGTQDIIRVNSNDHLKQLKALAATLSRRVPRSQYVRDLLSRNVEIAARSDRLYAVGRFEEGSRSRLGVAGGTAWGVEAFADRIADGTAVGPLFFFCTRARRWHRLTDSLKWVRVDDVPAADGRYGGIGSRDLSPAGTAAISSLFTNTRG
jgi:hypothetical protein